MKKDAEQYKQELEESEAYYHDRPHSKLLEKTRNRYKASIHPMLGIWFDEPVAEDLGIGLQVVRKVRQSMSVQSAANRLRHKNKALVELILEARARGEINLEFMCTNQIAAILGLELTPIVVTTARRKSGLRFKNPNDSRIPLPQDTTELGKLLAGWR